MIEPTKGPSSSAGSGAACAALPRRSNLLALGLAALVGITAVSVHWKALECRALGLDDYDYLIKNPLVQNPSWANAGQVLSEVYHVSVVAGYYHPLGILSLMLDCAMGGSPTNLRPFRVTSLALHGMCAILVVILLWRMFEWIGPAALMGLLFAVHPLTIEPIPWLGERKTLLTAFFSLLAMIAFVERARLERLGRAPKLRMGLLGACAILFALAVLAKPTSTPLPVMLLLLDFWPLRRLGWRVVLEKLPLFVVSGVSIAITLQSHGETGVISTPGEQGAMRVVFTVCYNIWHYVCKMVRPGDLSFFYPYPMLSWANADVRFAVIAATVLVLCVLVTLRWTRSIATGWAFLAVAISPALGIIAVNVTIAGDRFLYLPSLGVLMMLTYALTLAWRQCKWGFITARRVLIVLAVFGLATAEVRGTVNNYHPWRDTETLFRHMLRHHPDSARIHVHLAFELSEQQEFDSSVAHYREALRLQPNYPGVALQLATVLGRMGRLDEATEAYELELKIDPTSAKAHSNLAALLAQGGKPEQAMPHFAFAIKLDPGNVRARSNYGAALARMGRYDEAIQQCREAIRIEPNFGPGHTNLSRVYFTQGKVTEAVGEMRIAMRLEPRSVGAFVQLGGELATGGRRDAAVAVYREIVAAQPNHPVASERLRQLGGG
ncbi:MAG: tetratricopeptide repeat protein [Planctomycetota bacterium]